MTIGSPDGRIGVTIEENSMTGTATSAIAIRHRDNGTWSVSTWPGRRFTQNQAVTAMMLAETEAAGGGDSPHAIAWREELENSLAPVIIGIMCDPALQRDFLALLRDRRRTDQVLSGRPWLRVVRE
jgi:hypothetical protein